MAPAYDDEGYQKWLKTLIKNHSLE
jgi:hypothetical protein